MSAIKSQYSAKGERSHLSMGMGNRYSQMKGGMKGPYVFSGKMK